MGVQDTDPAGSCTHAVRAVPVFAALDTAVKPPNAQGLLCYDSPAATTMAVTVDNTSPARLPDAAESKEVERVMNIARTSRDADLDRISAAISDAVGHSPHEARLWALHALMEIAEIGFCVARRAFAGVWMDNETHAPMLADAWMRRAKAWIGALICLPLEFGPTGKAQEHITNSLRIRWLDSMRLDRGRAKDCGPDGVNVAVAQFERIAAEASWLAVDVCRWIGIHAVQSEWRAHRDHVRDHVLPTRGSWPPGGYAPSALQATDHDEDMIDHEADAEDVVDFENSDDIRYANPCDDPREWDCYETESDSEEEGEREAEFAAMAARGAMSKEETVEIVDLTASSPLAALDGDDDDSDTDNP